MAEQGSVAIWPKRMRWLIFLGVAAFGFTLYTWAPDPFAMIDAGGRPDKPLAIIKWGGMLIAVFALARLFGFRRIGAGPAGMTISTLLKRKSYSWSDLREAKLDPAEAIPLGYRLRFEGASIQLSKRDYAEADIAALRDIVRAHRGVG